MKQETRNKIPLPHWWGPRQRAKNTVIFAGVRLGVALARILPFFALRALGQTLAAFGFVFAVRERRRAIAQLRQSLPTLRHPVWTIFRMFLHFGRLAAEWVKIERFTLPGSRFLQFDAATQTVLREALAEGHGVLFIAPHLGNWEILAQAAARHGFACATVAKETYDPRITALLAEFRARAGVQSLWRGDPAVMSKLQATLRSGGVLGALIDQDTKVPSIFVPFFGRPASTPVVPQLLAVRNKAAVVFGYAARHGSRYRITFERVPRPDTGDRKRDAATLTELLTQRIEAAIVQTPEQWVWIHARWRRQPVAEPLGND